MSSFSWSPLSSGSSSGVTSLNSLAGALTLAAGSGITITPSGGDTLTIASTGAGTWNATKWASADSHAQNAFGTYPNIYGDSLQSAFYMVSTTDVPLLNTTNPGAWLILVAADVLQPTSAQAAGKAILSAGNTAGSGLGGNVEIYGGFSEGAAGGDIIINAGGTNGAFAGGDIQLTPGTTNGGTAGKIQFVDGSEGVSGYVWTSTDINGSGAWMAASGGGANTTLSNLAAPTAINRDLRPDSPFNWSLGSSSFPWDRVQANAFVSNNSDLTDNCELAIFDTPSAVGLVSNVTGFVSQSYPNSFAVKNDDDSTADATAAGSIIIKAGDKGAGTGDGGNIFLQPGISAGGVTGTITATSDMIFDKASTTVRIHTKNDATDATQRLYIASGDATGFGTGGVVLASGQADTDSTGPLNLITGDTAAADVDSGDLTIATGLVSGIGVRGKIALLDGSEGTPGSVWTSTDAAGSGTWLAGASGTFTTADLKTVTVVSGVITSIV